MAHSTVPEGQLLNEVQRFNHAVLAFIDERGYPLNVAADFTVDSKAGTIKLARPSVPGLPRKGAEVNVTFSHIRPQPGVGYDQRRYVTVWGRVRSANGELIVTPERSHGWDEEKMSFFELCERSVPVAHEYMRKLSRERGEEVKAKLAVGWLIFLATRVPFLTATIVPVMLGALVARSHGFSSWWLTMLALLGACAIHLALNVTNDVADATSGADEANVNPTMFSGGSRMIQYGLVSLQAMKRAAIGLYAAGIAIGLYLAATRGVEILWLGVAGVFLSIFYSAGPLRLVHRGVGEICVALGFGPIMVLGAYYVVAQRWSFEAFYASLPVALLIMLVLYVNSIPDRPADARTGKRTLIVRLSKEAVIRGYALSVGLTFALIAIGAATGLMPIWTLIALATIPMALQVYRDLEPHYDNPYALMGPMGKNIGLHFITGLLLILGYTADVVF
ncbi:MAG TPA: prenyltransferase [Actinomycetota bacterium]|nr:prenyltransferase [Actinomycetota bacterium]